MEETIGAEVIHMVEESKSWVQHEMQGPILVSLKVWKFHKCFIAVKLGPLMQKRLDMLEIESIRVCKMSVSIGLW